MKILRMKAGKSIKEIESDVGVSRQAISRWENATANFPEERIPLYLKALGKTQADVDREMAMLSEEAEPFQHSPLAGLESFDVTDESMSPWCEPGEVVLFQRGRHPRRMEGCLVEMKDGSVIIRQYLRERDGYVFLLRVNPESTEQYLHSTIAAIHKIAFRGN